MPHPPAPRIGRTPSAFRRNVIPIGATMLASLAAVLPIISVAPLMPPWGLIVFLSWRALHRNIWPAWIGLPLGLWDDIFSGAVMGSAMLLWTITLISYEIIDRRMIWREFREEWGLSSIVITLVLLGGLVIAVMTGGGFQPHLLVPQILISILIFPLVTRFCAILDHWRLS